MSGGFEYSNPHPAQPEVLMAPSAHERLHDAFRIAAAGAGPQEDPEEILAGQRQILWQQVTRNSRMHPADAADYQALGEVLDYAWFGGFRDEPPAALARQETRASDIFVTTTKSADDILIQLLKGPLDAVMDAREASLRKHAAELHARAEDALRETPGYQLLTSFLTEKPSEAPLSPRQIDLLATPRQAALRHQMTAHPQPSPTEAAQSGRMSSEPFLLTAADAHKQSLPPKLAKQVHAIPPHPSVLRRPMEKILTSVELTAAARRQQPSPSVQNPYLRLHAFLRPYIEDFARQQGLPTDNISHFTGINYSRLYFSDDFYGYNTRDVLRPLMSKNRVGMLEATSDLLIGEAASVIMLSAEQEQRPYLEWVESYVSVLAGKMVSDCHQVPSADLGIPKPLVSLTKDITSIPVRARTDVPHQREGLPDAEHIGRTPSSSGDFSFTPAQLIARLAHRRYGKIVRRPSRGVAGRMAIETALPDNLPGVNPFSADMVITTKRAPRAGALDIHGFRLVGADSDRRRFSYVEDPNGDAFAPCYTLLTEEQQATAVQIARTATMPGLAKMLAQAEGLTVDSMLNLISRYVHYHAPGKKAAETKTRVPIPKSAADLAKFVNPKTGHMRTQCRITAAACRIFLTEPGLGETGRHVGVPLGYGKKIGSVYHEQVPFIDARTGNMHIIDITPPMNILKEQWFRLTAAAGSLASRLTVLRTTENPTSNSAGLRASASPTVLPARGRKPTKERILTADERERRLAAIHQDMYRQLGIALGAQQSPLPEYAVASNIARRPATDLLRLTAEIVGNTLPMANLPADPIRISHYRALSLLDYINRLRTAPSTVRDPHHYTGKERLLGTCEHLLRRVAANTTPNDPS